MSTMRTVEELILTLPPELYKMVEDYTFCAGPTTQHINATYKPPTALGVSKTTREKFAQSHYAHTAFTTSNQSHLRRWLLSLPQTHVGMMQHLHFKIDHAQDATNEAAQPQPQKQKQQPQKNNIRDPDSPKERRRGKKIARKEQEQRKRENDPDYSDYGVAEARKFFVMSYLRKRKIHLGKEVMKVNVKFKGMEERVWTDQPQGLYKERQKEKRAKKLGLELGDGAAGEGGGAVLSPRGQEGKK